MIVLKTTYLTLQGTILKLILVHLFLLPITPQVCDQIYKCGDKQLLQSKCLLKSANEPSTGFTTFYLRKCPSSQRCVIPANSVDNFGYCVSPLHLGWEGDYCNYHSECMSNVCSGNRCIPHDDGADCSSDAECNKRSSCAISLTVPTVQRKCKKLSNIDDVCLEDRECPFNYACGKDHITDLSKRCIQMHIIETGAYSTNRWLCKSEQIVEVSGKGTLCTLSRLVNRDEVTCSIGSKCRIMYYFNDDIPSFEKEVDCNCSANGTSYCGITNDSIEMRNYLKVYEETVAKVNIHGKHLAVIRENGWDNKLIQEALVRVKHYTQFIGADECAVQYWASTKIGGLSVWVLCGFMWGAMF